MAVRYALRGESYTFDDLTLGEVADLEKELEVPWGLIAPLHRMQHTLAVLRKFLERSVSVEEATRLTSALTIEQLNALVEYFEDEDEVDDADPKAQESTPDPSAQPTT